MVQLLICKCNFFIKNYLKKFIPPNLMIVTRLCSGNGFRSYVLMVLDSSTTH